MKKIFFSVLLFILLFVSGCNSNSRVIECYHDSDCVKVQITCCPCFKGGEEACVPNSFQTLCLGNIQKNCGEGEAYCFGLSDNCQIKNCICSENKCTSVLKNEKQ